MSLPPSSHTLNTTQLFPTFLSYKLEPQVVLLECRAPAHSWVTLCTSLQGLLGLESSYGPGSKEERWVGPEESLRRLPWRQPLGRPFPFPQAVPTSSPQAEGASFTGSGDAASTGTNSAGFRGSASPAPSGSSHAPPFQRRIPFLPDQCPRSSCGRPVRPGVQLPL